MSIFSGVNNPGVSLNQFTTAQYNALITFSALTDPGANRILGWDTTDAGYQFFVIGSGLTYTHATHTLSAGAVSGLTIGTSTITSGTDTRILYDNAGVLGEYTLTGTGTVVAMATSPSFTTPTLGVASATTINKVTLTTPATGSTLTIANGKTLTVSNSGTLAGGDAFTLAIAASKTLTISNTMTLAGGDSTSITFPNAAATMARTDAANTFTGHQTIEGVTSTGATGTGKFVFDGTPTLVTPVLGVATITSINKVAITAPATSATLTIADGKTLTISNTMTLAGGDSTSITFPNAAATMARTDAGQTFTGVNVFTSPKIITQVSDTNGNVLINIGATASAVNYVKITNAATGTVGPIVASDGETNVDLKISAKGTGKIHHTSGAAGDITAYSPAGAGTATLTLNTSNIHTITMPAGNITIALSNEQVGQCFIINILQDGTGSRTVTWFTTIKWAGGSAPTLTTTASKIDTLGFIVTSAGNYQGYIVGQNL